MLRTQLEMTLPKFAARNGTRRIGLGLGLTSYGLGFFGVVPGRPPIEAPPWPGYSIFVKSVIQIGGEPHHTGSCPALVSELFKNRLSPLASKQAKRKK